ncbi:MAG: hypothetical protein ACYDGR_09980 [Candidatus Dormibacteria bacterium]
MAPRTKPWPPTEFLPLDLYEDWAAAGVRRPQAERFPAYARSLTGLIRAAEALRYIEQRTCDAVGEGAAKLQHSQTRPG